MQTIPPDRPRNTSSRQPESFTATADHSALISVKRVQQLTGFASSTPIYNRLREKKFPEPVRLSARCTRWRLREVLAWIEARTGDLPDLGSDTTRVGQ